MKRKSPIQHKVRSHVRNGHIVHDYTRGKGLKRGRYIFRKRLPTKTVKLREPGGRVVPIDYAIAKGIKAVWQKGWRTSECCSSHIGEHIAPYVDFSNIPMIHDPDFYKPLEKWFEQHEKELDLNFHWEVCGSIFLIDVDGKRIDEFVSEVDKDLHKKLVNDLNKILLNLPKKEELVK